MKRFYLFLAVHLIYSFSFCSADYILAVGLKERTYFDVFGMDREGGISLTPEPVAFPPQTQFSDPVDFIISPSGNYALFSDFWCDDGLIYSINDANHFQFIQQLGHESFGGGFSAADQYFFTSTGYHHYTDHGTLLVYQWNTNRFEVVTTETVPTSATLSKNVICTSKDEVFGSTKNGSLESQSGGVLYHLDRQTNHLELRQYWSSWISGVDRCALSKDENLILFGGRQQIKQDTFSIAVMGTLKRSSSGEWQLNPIYRDPQWGRAAGIMEVNITPDMQYAVAFLSYPVTPSGGIWVMNINADGSLSAHSNLGFEDGQRMAMSPDGKYIAIAWNYGATISVVRLYPNGNLEEVDRISGPAVGCMAFLPQALPPPITAANDACELYDGSRSSNISISAKKSKPSEKPANAAHGGEWQRLKIDDRASK